MWACAPVEPSPTASFVVPSPTGAPTEPALRTDAPTPSIGEETPILPPLNDLERSVIAALAELGLEGWRAQLPFENADIWVRIDDARQLSVSVLPLRRDPGGFVAVSTRSIRGVQVEKGDPSEYEGDLYQFRCGDLRYFVGGFAPPPFADLDSFIEALLGAIECPPPG